MQEFFKVAKAVPCSNPYLNKRKCPAIKEMCKAIAACPCGAIAYVADETEPLGGRIVFDHEKCDACGLCVTACCGEAIEMRTEGKRG